MCSALALLLSKLFFAVAYYSGLPLLSKQFVVNNNIKSMLPKLCLLIITVIMMVYCATNIFHILKLDAALG